MAAEGCLLSSASSINFLCSLNKRRYLLRILPLPVCILHTRRYVDDVRMDEGNRPSYIGCRKAARKKP